MVVELGHIRPGLPWLAGMCAMPGPSEPRREDLASQGPFDQADAPGRSREPESLHTVRGQQVVNRMRRNMLGQLTAGRAVPLAGTLNTTRRITPCHHGQGNRVSPQYLVLPVLRRHDIIQQPGRSSRLEAIAARRANGCRPARRYVYVHLPHSTTRIKCKFD